MSQMNSFDAELYPRFTNLKSTSPGLKVFISVGGWAAGGAVFSNMVSTAAARSTFIDSAIQFMRTYSFDGIDIDWEYPAAGDRDGVPADTENYVTFMKELRAACGSNYGISATIPSSYCKHGSCVLWLPYLSAQGICKVLTSWGWSLTWTGSIS